MSCAGPSSGLLFGSPKLGFTYIASEPAIIKTVYGAGYMFSADVGWS